MSSEAAVLGVPAVFIATTGRGYTDDEERRYGLVRHFTEAQYDLAGRDHRGDCWRLPAPDLGMRPAGACSTRRST